MPCVLCTDMDGLIVRAMGANVHESSIAFPRVNKGTDSLPQLRKAVSVERLIDSAPVDSS